ETFSHREKAPVGPDEASKGEKMKSSRRFIVFSVLLLSGLARAADRADTGGASYESQKATALAQPYANDAGPASIDVSSYPQEIQETYKNIFLVRCQRCHTASRPLNSQFVEPSAPKEQHPAIIAKWKAEHPEMFKDKLVWQIEGKSASGPGIWERYVKKMMSKPGCNISP